MLQILLAFLAISIVSVTGYGLIEQLSLQQVMMDQRENARRLDVAAEAVEGRLLSSPGLEGVYAPAPLNRSDGWSYMPAGVGGINATVDGVPFLYCPVASSAVVEDAGGRVGGVVKSPDGSSYDVQIKGGVVVGSQYGGGDPLNPGMSAYRPAAFIIAPNRGNDKPPNCTDVYERNGRPFVSGGLVRVVSRPAGAAIAGTISAASSDIYVSTTGTGNGRLSDPASIDDALRQWVNLRPSAMTIHFVGGGAVSVRDASLWSSFVGAVNGSPSRLVMDGGGATLIAPGGQVTVPADFSIVGGQAGFRLVGPTLIVGQGDQMSTQGNVSLQPASGGSGLYVQQGGRLNVSNGALAIGGSAQNGVEASGDVSLSGASVSGPGGWSLGLTNGGRLLSASGVVGDAAARNGTAGLAVSGAWSVSSDAASKVAASGSGVCWASLGSDDVTFAYSPNGAGARSAVPPDPAYSGPAPDAQTPGSVEAYQTYARENDGRRRARQTNHSNFLCV